MWPIYGSTPPPGCASKYMLGSCENIISCFSWGIETFTVTDHHKFHNNLSMILLLNGPELLIPLLKIASLVISRSWQSFTAKHYLVEVEGDHQGGRLQKTHVICVSLHNKKVIVLRYVSFFQKIKGFVIFHNPVPHSKGCNPCNTSFLLYILWVEAFENFPMKGNLTCQNITYHALILVLLENTRKTAFYCFPQSILHSLQKASTCLYFTKLKKQNICFLRLNGIFGYV